ncbi:kinesin, partial [Thraustotheca clavata]
MDSSIEDDVPAVVTAVRVRPMSEDERKAGCRLIVAMDGKQTIITDPAGLGSPRRSPTKVTLWKQAFNYDYSYWSYDPQDASYASQQCLYKDLGTRVLEDAWKGFNSSLFAYGQTGAGKSFSMMGKAKNSNNHNVATQGLIPRICHGLFEKINCKTIYSGSFLVKMSYVEIYNERVYDLLNRTEKDALKVREHPDKGAYVEHVSNHVVTSYHDIEYLLNEGAKTRRVAATEMNQVSSRSHAILTLSLRRELNHSQRISKICLVDLAGSERSELAQGPRLREAAYINKSLSALGEVIHTLATNVQSTNTSFVQYRNSILTRLLKDSLCGQSKLVMLAAISPCCIHYEETLSTLKYLDRVKIALSTATPPLMECTTKEPESGPIIDPSFTEMTFYCIEVGVTTVGKPHDDDAVPDIVLDGHDILPLHCVFHYEENGQVIIRPALGANIFLNGKDIKNMEACNVPNNSRITFGAHHVFRFDMPHIASINDSGVDWTFAHNELLEALLPIKQASAMRPQLSDSIGIQCNGNDFQPNLSITTSTFSMNEEHNPLTQTTDSEVQCELLLKNKDKLVLHNIDAETLCDQSQINFISAESQCDILPTNTQPTSSLISKEITVVQKPIGVDVGCQISNNAITPVATQCHDIEKIGFGTQASPQCATISIQCSLDSDQRILFSEADKISLERKLAKLKLLLKKKDRQIKALSDRNDISTPTQSVQPVVDSVYDPTFDENLLQLRNNLSAKHNFPPQEVALPKQDDIVWRSTILADIETFVEATPTYDNALDSNLLKLREQLATFLDVVPENVELPTSDGVEWRNSIMFDISTLVDALPQTNQILPTITISSSEPTYKSLLDNYMIECKKQLSLLTESKSSNLANYAKVIAALETRFASLCCALNVKCHHEESVFQQVFNTKVIELRESFEQKLASYQATTLLNSQILNRLENQLQEKLNKLTTEYKEQHDVWSQQLQNFTKDQFESMSRLGAEAAFHDEQARMQIAEWDTKCHRLVSETDIVLSETRAMHLKNLRRLEEKFALNMHEVELKRMQEEENCLRASEALVQKYEATILNRIKEQEKWEAQKQEDLSQLQADHAVAMSYLASQHTDMYSQAREAREIYSMSEED